MTEPIPDSTPTREDWLAAHIGIADADCGCRQPAAPREMLSPLARLIVWVVGDRAPRPLANPRLEALRRFFCATRAGHRPGVALVSELHVRGVQPAHLAVLTGLLA